MAAYACHDQGNTAGICHHDATRYAIYVASLINEMIACIFLWTGSFTFIDSIAHPREKQNFFGIFHPAPYGANLIANSMNIVFYTYKFNTIYCFADFYGSYAIVTCSILCLLPGLTINDRVPCDAMVLLDRYENGGNGGKRGKWGDGGKGRVPGIGDAIQVYLGLLRRKETWRVLHMMINSGLNQMFSAAAFYRLVVMVYEGTTADEYHVKVMISLQILIFAVGAIAVAQIIKIMPTTWLDKAKLLNSSVSTAVMIFLSFAIYRMNSIWLAYILVFFIGGNELAFNQLFSMYAALLESPTESFALYKMIQNIFCALNCLFFILSTPQLFYTISALIFSCLFVWLVLNMKAECPPSMSGSHLIDAESILHLQGLDRSIDLQSS